MVKSLVIFLDHKTVLADLREFSSLIKYRNSLYTLVKLGPSDQHIKTTSNG